MQGLAKLCKIPSEETHCQNMVVHSRALASGTPQNECWSFLEHPISVSLNENKHLQMHVFLNHDFLLVWAIRFHILGVCSQFKPPPSFFLLCLPLGQADEKIWVISPLEMARDSNHTDPCSWARILAPATMNPIPGSFHCFLKPFQSCLRGQPCLPQRPLLCDLKTFSYHLDMCMCVPMPHWPQSQHGNHICRWQ